MIPGRIAGATRVLGAPKDWNEERDGPCAGLPILDLPAALGGNFMFSAWLPTPDELAAIAAGASIIVGIAGFSHPVISLGVSATPNDEAPGEGAAK
jgi:hypothetical protein